MLALGEPLIEDLNGTRPLPSGVPGRRIQGCRQRNLLQAVEPRDGLIDGSFELCLINGIELACEFLVVDQVPEVVGIRLETILGSDMSTSELILGFVFLSLGNHALDLLLGKMTLVIGDSDVV